MRFSYPIICTHKRSPSEGCANPAQFKIAARWSDGITAELNTYALCCPSCLEQAYRLSCEKHSVCRAARGETLEAPGIYELKRGTLDVQLTRRQDLEASFAR